MSQPETMEILHCYRFFETVISIAKSLIFFLKQLISLLKILLMVLVKINYFDYLNDISLINFFID